MKSKVVKLPWPARTVPVDLAQDARHEAIYALLNAARPLIANEDFRTALCDVEALRPGAVETAADVTQEATFTWEDRLVAAAIELADREREYSELIDAELDAEAAAKKTKKTAGARRC